MYDQKSAFAALHIDMVFDDIDATTLQQNGLLITITTFATTTKDAEEKRTTYRILNGMARWIVF